MPAPRQVSRVRQIGAQWVTFPDQQRSWIEPAASLAHGLHRTRPFDVVWSTSPPESVHYVARAIARVGVPWIADFRDQWSDYPSAAGTPSAGWVIERISRRVLSRAFAQTGASEGICRSLRRATGRPTICVRNGFDPIGRLGKPPFPRRLGYFGCVDPRTQHPERLWAPLRALRDHGRPGRSRCSYRLGEEGARGWTPRRLEGPRLREASLPHPEALEAMQRMTALLVLPWRKELARLSCRGSCTSTSVAVAQSWSVHLLATRRGPSWNPAGWGWAPGGTARSSRRSPDSKPSCRIPRAERA